MRIAFVLLTRGNVSGGSRKHLLRIVPLLRQHPDVKRLDVLVPPQMASGDDLTWPERDELFGFRNLRRTLRSLAPDVIFIPTARFLGVPGVPVVTMVRNMEPLEVPFGGNALTEGLKNVARAAAARAACLAADRVIAVSQHVRNFLVERMHIPGERIGIVHHGVDMPVTDAYLAPATAAPLEGSRFLFTAGSIRPARGLEDVIAALAELPGEIRLAIAGSVDRGAEPYARRLRSLAERKGMASRVVWLGQLEPGGMAWCFRNAALFVMTSRAEACPNTVLEAMAHGSLSVSTDHAPMPEFFADAAVYYRERDASDLAVRLNEALTFSEGVQSSLRAKALARAGLFTWAATAENTVAELQRAVTGSG